MKLGANDSLMKVSIPSFVKETLVKNKGREKWGGMSP